MFISLRSYLRRRKMKEVKYHCGLSRILFVFSFKSYTSGFMTNKIKYIPEKVNP